LQQTNTNNAYICDIVAVRRKIYLAVEVDKHKLNILPGSWMELLQGGSKSQQRCDLYLFGYTEGRMFSPLLKCVGFWRFLDRAIGSRNL